MPEFGNTAEHSNVASNATWYPNSTNHLFSFTESGWFFRLLRHLPQALRGQQLFWIYS